MEELKGYIMRFGKVAKTCYFKDKKGKEQGTRIDFINSGIVNYTVDMLNGQYHGKHIMYNTVFENAKFVYINHYKKGEKFGQQQTSTALFPSVMVEAKTIKTKWKWSVDLSESGLFNYFEV